MLREIKIHIFCRGAFFVRFSCKSRVPCLTAPVNQDGAFFSLELMVKILVFKA